MSDKSPLFVSSLELLAHATELYVGGKPRNNKFVILHLANAIELIVKDCLIDHGVSIYKNPKETITIWGAFNELDELGMPIAEKPIIELLIDDRNTIQHRFGFPNADAVFYYLEETVSFFVRFLREHYKVDLAEALENHLSPENLALLGLAKDNYRHLKKLLEISPEAAIQQAYASVQAEMDNLLFSFSDDPGIARRFRPMAHGLEARFLEELAERGYLPDDIWRRYQSLQELRNSVAHGRNVESEEVDWQRELDTAIKILCALDQAKEDGILTPSNESGPFNHLAKLSPEFNIDYADYVARAALDRIRLMPAVRSNPEIASHKNTFVGILHLLASKGYLPEDIEEKYELIHEHRRTARKGKQYEESTWRDMLMTAEAIVSAVQRAREDRIFTRKTKS